MRGRLLGLLALSVAVMLSATSVVNAVSLSMDGSQWAVRETLVSDKGKTKYVTTHATTVEGGVEFAFPRNGFARSMVDQYTVSLTTENTLRATFVVTTTVTTVSPSEDVFVGSPGSGCPGAGPSVCPGMVRLFFQSVFPAVPTASCTGGPNADRYWWAAWGSPYYQLSRKADALGTVSTTVTLELPLDPARWSNMCGQFGTHDGGTAFVSALLQVKAVGLSFGSGWFFMNGVGVDSDLGSATFTLTSFEIL